MVSGIMCMQCSCRLLSLLVHFDVFGILHELGGADSNLLDDTQASVCSSPVHKHFNIFHIRKIRNN